LLEFIRPNDRLCLITFDDQAEQLTPLIQLRNFNFIDAISNITAGG